MLIIGIDPKGQHGLNFLSYKISKDLINGGHHIKKTILKSKNDATQVVALRRSDEFLLVKLKATGGAEGSKKEGTTKPKTSSRK